MLAPDAVWIRPQPGPTESDTERLPQGSPLMGHLSAKVRAAAELDAVLLDVEKVASA